MGGAPKPVITYRRPTPVPKGVPGRYTGTVIIALIVLAVAVFAGWRAVEARRAAAREERERVERDAATVRYEAARKKTKDDIAKAQRETAEYVEEMKRRAEREGH